MIITTAAADVVVFVLVVAAAAAAAASAGVDVSCVVPTCLVPQLRTCGCRHCVPLGPRVPPVLP